VGLLGGDPDRPQVDRLLLRGVGEALISKNEDADDDERDASEERMFSWSRSKEAS